MTSAKRKENDMLWEIVRREILDNITSVRIGFTLVIMIVVMVLAGIIFNIKYEQIVEDHSQAVSSNLEELRKQAVKDGMTTLMQDGIRKVFLGLTDLQQVRKVCIK